MIGSSILVVRAKRPIRLSTSPVLPQKTRTKRQPPPPQGYMQPPPPQGYSLEEQQKAQYGPPNLQEN